jgi:hypothetical protein
MVDLLRVELDRYTEEFGAPRPSVVRSMSGASTAG